MIELTQEFHDDRKRVVAIGNFDGFHRGHQMLFSKLQKYHGCIKTIITFENMMKDYHLGKYILTSIEDKNELAKLYGIDEILYIPFSNEVKHMSPEDFIKKYLNNLNIEAIVVGSDFRFGYKASGTPELLRSEYKNVEVVNLLIDSNTLQKISTTKIIELIINNSIETANNYLGRNYSIKGTIEHGYQNGRLLGFPTANIRIDDNYALPKGGVFATKIQINSNAYLSMTNIGTHPTLDELVIPSIETNIFDFTKNIYNEKVQLTFLEFLRDEVKFKNKNELIEQLKKDKNYIVNKYKI